MSAHRSSQLAFGRRGRGLLSTLSRVSLAASCRSCSHNSQVTTRCQRRHRLGSERSANAKARLTLPFRSAARGDSLVIAIRRCACKRRHSAIMLGSFLSAVPSNAIRTVRRGRSGSFGISLICLARNFVFDYRVGPPWKWVHFEIVVDKSHALGYRKVDECERGQAANNGRRTHQRESIPSKRTRENEIGNRAVTKRA